MRGLPRFAPTARRWCLIAGLLIVASWLTFLIQAHVTGGRTPFILFFPVIVIAGVYAGLWPAIASALVGLIVTVINWRIRGTSPASVASAVLLLALFLFATGVIIAVAVRTRQLLDSHRKFNQQLTEAQQRLDIAHIAARMVEWHWDIGSGKVQLSNSAKEVFGTTWSDIDQAWPLTHPGDRRALDETVQKALANESSYQFANRMIRPDTGEQRWIDTRAVIHRNASGAATHVTGVTFDVTEKYAAAEALRVSEEQLRLALEGARIGMWSVDTQAGVTHSSDTNLAIFGLTEEHRVMSNADWAELVHPQDLEVVRSVWRTAAEQVSAFELEYRIKRYDGTERWIHTRGRFSALTPGTLTGVGVSMDITDRKLAEQDRDSAQRKLRDAIEEFETILKLAPVGIVVSRTPESSKILRNPYVDKLLSASSNEAAADVLGDTTSSYRFMKASRQLDPAELPFIRAAQTGEAVSNELIELFAGNQRRAELLMSAVPLTDMSGKPRGAIGTMLDVTVVREMEAALQHREEQLRLATEAAEIGFWDVDPIHNTLVWPPLVKAMFGISPGKSVSMKDFYAGLHPDDRDRVTEAFSAACDPQRRALYDVEYRTIGQEDGIVRWVAAKGRGIFDSRDVCIRVIGAAIEISARKLAEAQLRRLNENLEQEIQKRTSALLAAEAQLRQAQKMEAIGHLTGGIAHDFNNLLQGVSGSLDMIRRKPDDMQKVKRWAEAGLQAAERGAKLTGQLLTFSRSQKLETKPFNLSEHLYAMRDLLQRTLGPAVQLRLDVNDPPNWVFADPVQTEMAILNLAINARDAMPTGGTLCIRTQRCSIEHDPELGSGHYIMLSVIDSGTGMSGDTLARAFDPFFTTKGVGKGTGLGLSQVYGATKQAGGVVRIESRLGAGTTVRMYLPECEARDAAPLVSPSQASTRPKNTTLLVVDDDFDVRTFLLDALESLGYEVVGAANADEAIAMFATSQPDLAILDFAMPGRTGDVIAHELRQQNAELPIIFASGYADTAAVMAAAGENAIVLRKPFTIDDLNAAIVDQLSKRKVTTHA